MTRASPSKPAQLQGFGLTIVSDLAFPGAVPVGADSTAGETIRVTLAESAPAVGPQPLYRREGEMLHFAPPGVGEYAISHGGVHVTVPPGADLDNVVQLLVATALPGLLWMRGKLVLHAAGVVLPGSDSVVALAGNSGAGKSTVAHQLVERGARLAGDDTLALGQAGGAITADGLPGGLHLGRAAERSFRPLAANLQAQGMPLGAIVVIVPQDTNSGITRLAGVEAAQAILSHRHRPTIPQVLGLRAPVAQLAIHMAQHIPVFAWHLPRGGDRLAQDAMARLAELPRAGIQGIAR